MTATPTDAAIVQCYYPDRVVTDEHCPVCGLRRVDGPVCGLNPDAAIVEAVRAEREDTVAFVQEWLMSSDHEPTQWDRDFAAAIDARSTASAQGETA